MLTLYLNYTIHKNILDRLFTINDLYKMKYRISTYFHDQLRKSLQKIKFGLEILYENLLDNQTDSEYI